MNFRVEKTSPFPMLEHGNFSDVDFALLGCGEKPALSQDFVLCIFPSWGSPWPCSG